MNSLNEIRRINNYTNKNKYLLEQDFVKKVDYRKVIIVGIYKNKYTDEKVRYLPTCVKGRKVVVEILPFYDFFSAVKLNTYYNQLPKLSQKIINIMGQ